MKKAHNPYLIPSVLVISQGTKIHKLREHEVLQGLRIVAGSRQNCTEQRKKSVNGE